MNFRIGGKGTSLRHELFHFNLRTANAISDLVLGFYFFHSCIKWLHLPILADYMDLTLYQTVEDRGNPDEIENEGPFPCSRKSAWLGYGFYFWDTHIQLGHWWGELSYGEDNYIICLSRGFLDETCWDLHGNGNHRLEYEEICEEIVKEGLTTKEKLIVPQVITYMKQKGFFVYKAIRALGMESISSTLRDPFIVFRMNFNKNYKSYLDLRPPVQICLLQKKALSLQGYTIVYPEHYVDYSFA